VLIQSYLEREDLSTTPLLQVALEGFTGINGKSWKEVDDSQLTNGIDLDIPALQQVLSTSLELSLGARQLNLHGLQPTHYVKTGSRILMPRQQRNNALVKWLKKFRCRLDLAAMDNVFATIHVGNHFFTIAWCRATGTFTLRDSLAKETKPEHCRTMIVLWAFLLASSRMEGHLWTKEPLLAISGSQVLGEFKAFLLSRPEGDQQGPLLQCERDNLRRMGIKVLKESEETVGAWTWSRDPHFPQQSNFLDCGMVAVVTVIHLSRGWQIPSMHATSIAGYRQWLVQVITNDCEKVFEVPCHSCGTNQLHSQMKKVECRDKQRCDETRESLLDDAVCISHGGNSSPAHRRKRPTGAIQTQTQKPLGDNGNRATDKSKPLVCQTKVADATDMDIDVVSDQTQHPKDKTENIGLGAEAEPGEVSASGGEAMVTANRQ
jgi:hypothetical protein